MILIFYSEAEGVSITPSRSDLLSRWVRSGSFHHYGLLRLSVHL